MEQTKANTEVSEFKIIDDEKNTPTLKEAQDFVGGCELSVSRLEWRFINSKRRGQVNELTS